jgi:hypothetical protein
LNGPGTSSVQPAFGATHECLDALESTPMKL